MLQVRENHSIIAHCLRRIVALQHNLAQKRRECPGESGGVFVMPLKLRPTGLGSGIDKDRPDYSIHTGEWEIGRVYQTRGGPESLRSSGP